MSVINAPRVGVMLSRVIEKISNSQKNNSVTVESYPVKAVSVGLDGLFSVAEMVVKKIKIIGEAPRL